MKPKPHPLKKVSQVKYTDGHRGLKITHQPGSFVDQMLIRTLPGVRMKTPGTYFCPRDRYFLYCLEAWGFTLTRRLQSYLTHPLDLKNPIPKKVGRIPGLLKEPFDYQYEGIGFLERLKGRALLGDQMGLGKTLQAIAWLHLHPEARPAVIVVPGSLKWNWKQEIEEALPDPKIQILSGVTPNENITGDFIIINYDILFQRKGKTGNTWLKKLKKVKPKVLVIDEIHYLLGNSKRTRAVKSLSRITKHIIGISGTPSVNRARELYNPIKMIAPHLLPNKWMFQFAYCGPEHNGYGWKFEGASHTKELHGLLSQIMIRRKKKDVWKNAPPKIRSLVPIEIDNRKEYETCEENFVAWVMQNKKKIKSIEGLAGNKLEMLRQVAIRGKMKGVLRWIEDYLNVVDKLVVFAYHKETINKIFDCFKKRSVKIDGSIPTNKRLGIVQAFQTDPKINLLIGQTEAAGTGLNMTAAHNVAFVELPWSPGALDQCIDRIHRHGQTKACNIYLLLAMTTVDERSAKIIDRKRKDLSLVLDGKTVDNRSLIGELLEQFKKGAKRLHAKNGLQTL